MSKPVKELIQKELTKRFEGIDSLAVVGFTGVDAITNNQIRARLRQKDIHLSVVKNSIARQAFKEIGLERAGQMLDGPCAVVYGGEDVSVVQIVRELLEINKETPALSVKAALLEGDIFGTERIEELSKFPTREEAIARLVGVVLAAGSKVAGCVLSPGSKVAALLKAIEEKQSEGTSEDTSAA